MLQIFPCALSVTTYHYFQLTELSTVFLHLNWMALKAQVNYVTLFSVSSLLLLTFLIRVLTTAFIVWHVWTGLLDLELWRVCFPTSYSHNSLSLCCATFLHLPSRHDAKLPSTSSREDLNCGTNCGSRCLAIWAILYDVSCSLKDYKLAP
jgi:hypothetical protein